jgi:hypothetical protein
MMCGAAGLWCPGCVTEGPAKPEAPKPKPAPREATNPTKVIVSPLSRVGVDNAGQPAIQLHLDFRDDENRSTKAFGQLRIELYPPAAVGADKAHAPTQAVDKTWEMDLNNALMNALTFDEMITRTYTITLTKVPDWLIQWSRHEGAPTTGAPTVVVQFAPPGATSEKILRATYSLTR